MNLYNLRLLAPGHYAMAKFSADFNVEAVYNLEAKGFSYTCDCPANNRSVVTKPCKHKRMMPLMLGAVNTDRFYDPEARTWCQPLSPFDEVLDKPIEGLPLAGEAVGSNGKGEPPIVGEALGSPTEGVEALMEVAKSIAQADMPAFNQAVKTDIEAGRLATIRREPAPTKMRR